MLKFLRRMDFNLLILVTKRFGIMMYLAILFSLMFTFGVIQMMMDSQMQLRIANWNGMVLMVLQVVTGHPTNVKWYGLMMEMVQQVMKMIGG